MSEDGRLIYWPALCGNQSPNDAFWNWYLTMNTTSPTVTSCFQKTALVWVPCGLLWLFTPVYAVVLARRPVYHSWMSCSKQNALTTVFAVFLMAVAVASLAVQMTNPGIVLTKADTIASAIQIVTFLLVAFYTRWQFRKGLHTSGVLFLFWLLTLVAEVIILTSLMTSQRTQDDLFVVHCVQFALVVVQLLLSCIADEDALTPTINQTLDTNEKSRFSTSEDDEERTPLLGKESLKSTENIAVIPADSVGGDTHHICPKSTSSVLSEAYFFWFTPTVVQGLKTPISKSDIWEVTEDISTEYNYPRFIRKWNKAVDKRKRNASKDAPKRVPHISSNNEKGKSKGGTGDSSENHQKKPEKEEKTNPMLTMVLVRTFGAYFSLGGAFLLVSVLLNVLGPKLLEAIIGFMESGDPFIWKGQVLATVLFFVTMFKTMAMEHHADVTQVASLKIRAALMGAIYRKAMRLSNSARRKTSVGAIVNLMAVDIDRLMRVLMQLHYLWASPLLIIMAMLLLWQQLGYASLAGLAVFVIILPLNTTFLVRKVRQLQTKKLKLMDIRLKLTGQVLGGIKVLKLYAWEPFFEKKLAAIRSEELKALRSKLMYMAGMTSVFTMSPILVSLACFATYTLTSPTHVLDAQKTFVSMALINMLNQPINTLSRMIVSLAEAMVSMRRLERYLLSEEIDDVDASDSEKFDQTAVKMKDCSFTWERGTPPYVKNINMEVDRGQLVAVVGTVGCGKSSLLAGLLGEMVSAGGKTHLKGSVAYVSQEPWIQNMSMRENILFTSPMDRPRYDRVLEACALMPDIEILPGGDMTEIGEKGINLSGGQKQRVSLARAVYSNADIYLLDDPLSAVDANVGKHLFEQVLGPQGLLGEKTRILVSHSVSYLPAMDSIVVMKDGCITEMGSYQQLLDNDAVFAEFLRNYVNAEEGEGGNGDNPPAYNGFDAKNGSRQRKRAGRPGAKGQAEGKGRMGRTLVEDEAVQTGYVKPAVIKYILSSAKWFFPFIMIGVALVNVSLRVLTQLWLNDWSSVQAVNGTQEPGTLGLRLGVYAGLSFGQAFGVIGVSLSLAFSAVIMAFSVHGHIAHAVMRSPMSFFETTPLGRIINRFSRDLNILDQNMPMTVYMLTNNLTALLTTLILVLYTVPIVAAVIAPVVIIFIVLQRMFLICVCQLQRINATSRSPLYTLLGETVAGAECIRAFGLQERFTLRMEKLLNTSQIVMFELISSSRWLSMSVQTIGNLITFATAMFGVAQDSVSPSDMGMALSFALQLSNNLAMAVRTTCELESQTVYVERVKEYSELPGEAPWDNPETAPPRGWPEDGAISFRDYQTTYRAGLESVLKGINCEIKPREKVGVVGRTGAGKSSLALALFRILEATDGLIMIDNTDLAELGLHDVRGRMSIIPQDPVLFAGTLRFNLDPADRHTDEELWNALAHAHLKEFVSSLPEQLLHSCDDDGGNLSVGQKQLVCLARALLRKSRILVLDEATAAVDMETDDLIQSTIRSECKSCTVITIAHRLNTVMDYDRVMVIDEGQIREFDSPTSLLQDTSSMFYAMARDAKLV